MRTNVVRLGLVLATALLVVLPAMASDSDQDRHPCPDLDFTAELRDQLNPASLLEDGQYLFENGEPLQRQCVRKRVCEVNDFTRAHFGQSYYVSLNRRGGSEIERQFPELVAAIVEGRGDTRMIYLNNFCKSAENEVEK